MNHVIGFLGTKLDHKGGTGHGRWETWRPTVGLCQQEKFQVDRFDLLYEEKFEALCELVCADIKQISPETEVRPIPVSLHNPWDFEEVYETILSVIESIAFEPESTQYFAHMTTGTHVMQICLFLLVESNHLPGKLLQTGPARTRGRAKPEGTIQIIDLDLSKYDRLATRFEKDQAAARDFLRSGIATRNAAFNQLIDEIEVVALRSTAPMLLSGPTGAGKTQLARRVFELRAQRCGLAGSFVEVNCATLRGDTAMSSLFGHTRGAFTGAQSERRGLLREADGGLLFLDEIGELGADEQAMLLRALEEGTFLPVGSDKPVSSSFQLIAGTNRELGARVATGEFRSDLLARIHLWSFELPSLAERREDIAPNIDYELRRFEERHGRAVSFNKEALAAFLKFGESNESSWQGNFRDLNGAIERMATLAERGRIGSADVAAELERLRRQWDATAGADATTGASVARDATSVLTSVMTEEALTELDPFDQVQLAYVIEVCRGSKNMSEAGRRLFAVSRTRKVRPNDADRLRKYLAKFGLVFDAVQNR